MKIQDLHNEHKAMQLDLNIKAQEIIKLIFKNKALKVELITFLIEEYGYYFDKAYFENSSIGEYKDMAINTYILSKDENTGIETVYTIDEAIMDNFEYLLPIIKRYED